MPTNDISSVSIDKTGNIWIGGNYNSGGGLTKFDGINWTTYTSTNSGLPTNFVNCISIDSNGTKWIGTNNGMAKFDGINWTIFNQSNSGLPSNYIQSISIDKSGNKWIDMGSSGFVRFDDNNWTVYNMGNSSLSGNVSCISIDSNQNKWIGTTDGGLEIFNEKGIVLSIPSISQIESSVIINIFPNPFSNSATIQITDAELRMQNVELKIYDLLGREIHQQTLNSKQETLNLKIPIGIYFYKITNEKTIFATGKIIVE